MRALQIHGAKDLRLVDLAPPPLSADEVRIKIEAGGICGSDLSYYFKGRVGDFALQQPMILGHEVAGKVVDIGDDVSDLAVGARVAIDPSRPCAGCDHCRAGRSNLCRDMLFYGSAARMPHVQGAFSELAIARGDQCHIIPDDMAAATAAAAEPLAVALHAVRRAGDLLGRRVIVAGAGPIGLLVVLAAKFAGAAEIVIFDIAKNPLAIAEELGVDGILHIDKGDQSGDRLNVFEAGKGRFDVAFEATGAVSALATLPRITRPGGKIVQIGMLPAGVIDLPANLLMAKEIDYLGSFRFHEEYTMAVDLLKSAKIDVTPLITDSFAIEDADRAFLMAADRERSIKVQLSF